MEREQIEKTLGERFAEPLAAGTKRRLIFWYDTDQQFVDLIDQLQIADTRIHRITDNNHFHTKYLLEVEDPDSNYLIYSTIRAADEDNWLLDSLLYSTEFYADRVLLYMEELGISPSLKFQVKHYEKFFSNSNRRKKMTSYNIDSYDEFKLEISMMSAVCGLKFADPLDIFKKVLGDSIQEESNRYLADINRFMDGQVFWKHAQRYFGFKNDSGSIIKLASFVLVNSLQRTLDGGQLISLSEYIANTGKENCIYFVDQWMNHKTDATTYDLMAGKVAQYLNIEERLAGLEVGDLVECDTFEWFDKKIIRYMINSILNNVENYGFCQGLIKDRRTRHWYEKYRYIYESLHYAFEILQYYKANSAIPILGAQSLWDNYASQYHYVDYCYRNFYWNFDQHPVDIMKPVQKMIENLYSNWFLDGLGTAWSSALAGESNKDWILPSVKGQQDFYKNNLDKAINAGQRCFVIISDALRYEVGQEIARRLNSEAGGEATISRMLGVLPSATKYGMAALLPHQQLALNSKDKVLADGNRTDSLADRDAVLKARISEALATDFQTLITFTKEQRREFVKGKRLLYIYHNSIDAMGDKAATEIKVFDAVQQAIEEILRLIRIVRDDLGGVNIYVTTDHGFIYKRDPLAESDKIKRETVDAFEEKRRYMLSYKTKETDSLLTFSPNYLQGDQGALVVYVPRGTIRFKVPGSGANYVHGGASLQEVVVPLINYKVLRGSTAKKMEESKVKIKLVNQSHKITNSLFTLEFFQTEKVGGKYIPCTVNIFIEDENGKILSNQEIIIADKKSEKPEERTFKLRMTLKTGKYDKNKDYYLIIKDTETKLAEAKIPFKINLAIGSDFDI